MRYLALALISATLAVPLAPNAPKPAAPSCTCPCGPLCGCDCLKGTPCQCGPVIETIAEPKLWSHLPDETTCAATWQQYEDWHQALEAWYWHVGEGTAGAPRHEPNIMANLEQEKAIIGWYKQVWWEAWWVQWPPATDNMKAEHANLLHDMVGDQVFWSGRLPSLLNER